MRIPKSLAMAACLALTLPLTLSLALPLSAEEHPAAIHAHDAYARMGGLGKSGAVFLMLHNMTETDDRLIGAEGDVAQKIELHTHQDMGDGVMKMSEIEGGLPLPAGEMHELARGGDHIMLMGLTADLKDGDRFPLTLIFEKAGAMPIEVEVDNDRPVTAEGEGHMQHGHGTTGHGTGG